MWWTANAKKHLLRTAWQTQQFWQNLTRDQRYDIGLFFCLFYDTPWEKDWPFLSIFTSLTFLMCYSSDNCQQLPVAVLVLRYVRGCRYHRLVDCIRNNIKNSFAWRERKKGWEKWCWSLLDWSLPKQTIQEKKYLKIKFFMNNQVRFFPLSHLFKHLEKGAHQN